MQADSHRVEIHSQYFSSVLAQLLRNARAQTPETKKNDIPIVCQCRHIVHSFTIGLAALEYIKPRCKCFIQCVRVEDHVRGATDSDQSHHGDQTQGCGIDVSKANT